MMVTPAPAEDGSPPGDAPAAGLHFDAFPFPPYDIQLELMRRIYATLDAGGVGVFESPTGTGKTLSLLCATLTWLEDALRKETSPEEATDPAGEAPGDDEPEWLREHGRTSTQRAAQERAAARAARRERIRAAALAATKTGHVFSMGRPGGVASRLGGRPPLAAGDPDAEFLMDDDWNSDEEGMSRRRAADRGVAGSDSDTPAGAGAQDEQDEYEPLQVVFCSRTHSQLAQVVGELCRTRFAGRFRAVVLAGRAVMCVNDAVRALAPPAARLNDACRDLQRKGKAKATKAAKGPSSAAADAPGASKGAAKHKGCPFLVSRGPAVAALREAVLEKPMDVEDMTTAGRATNACPYYAARGAVPAAHIIFLPYAALVNQDMREALGLRLAGAVIVVDEAHNLPEAVADAHSAVLTGPALTAASSSLDAYMARYKSRLAAGNARHLATLLAVAKALHKAVAAPPPAPASGDAAPGERVLRLNQFLLSSGIDHINLFKLARYCKESKVLLKVGGFGDARMAEAAAAAPTGEEAADPGAPGSPYPTSATAALQALLSFVVALTAPEADGRVLMWPAQTQGGASNRPHPHGRLKFVLLSPANRFAPVVGAARAVILAGGTLGPPAVLAASLCPGLCPGQLHSHSCGHIVPADHLLAVALARGPSGAALDFTYAGRSQPAAMDELGRVLLNVCRCAPHGCVAFFPSFEYVDACCARWASTGAWDTLGEAKPVFREPRTSGSVDALLDRYGTAACTGKGALLLCVVGGKLSEGINFSDRLGRCVVMVGLPYAPPSDAELAERMAWLDAATPEQGGGPGSGRAYYEALCMRAVNQSIGRAIRHAKDYAAIVLVDTRWTKPVAEGGVAGKLPTWMAGSLVTVNGSFGEAYGRMHSFFKRRAAAEAVTDNPAS